MRKKFKFEGGEFLEKDRKDHKIMVLRQKI
jgi:hypothetical protein